MENLGLCECGCGQKTNISKQNHTKNRLKVGVPFRFIKGHNIHNGRGSFSPAWKGGVRKGYKGKYREIWAPDHPSAVFNVLRESRLVAETITGKLLPRAAIVHHKDRNPENNSPDNLIVCRDQSHHMLIHQQEKSLAECGHSNWRKCVYCHQYDDPKNLVNHAKRSMTHVLCRKQYAKERYRFFNLK